MRNARKLAWKRISSKTVWDKDRIHLVEYSIILPDGKKSTYTLQHALGAVATLIEPEKGTILLTYQYRFPLDKWIYDLPGGEIDEGETPRQAAVRECEEEVGLKPKKLVHLATFYTNPSKVDWPMHIFFCSDFEKTKPIQTSSSETVEQVLMPIKKLEELISNSEIVDPSLLIGWFTAHNAKLL